MRVTLVLLVAFGFASRLSAADDDLARKARRVLDANCHRCHGQDGAVEGGLNYVPDLGKLVARKKVVPGDPDGSRLFRRVDDGYDAAGRRKPAAVGGRRGDPEEVDRGRGARRYRTRRPQADLVGRRAKPRPRRPGEVRPPGPAVPALLHPRPPAQRRAGRRRAADVPQRPREARQQPVVAPDHPRARSRSTRRRPSSASTCAGILWDAGTWNRVLGEYPYGVLDDTATARAVIVGTATKLPVVRGDWFVATASPGAAVLRPAANPAEPRRAGAATAGRRGGEHPAGPRRPGRVQRLRRVAVQPHPRTAPDSVHGAYWRTYDFDEPPAEPHRPRRRKPAPRPPQRLRVPARAGSGRAAVPARRRRGHLRPAQRAARVRPRPRRQHPARQGADRRRQRPEAAGPRGRGRRVVHVLPPHRHQPEGRPGPRPPGEEPEGVRPRRRRADPRAVPAEGPVTEVDGRGRQTLRRRRSRRPGRRSAVPRRSARSHCDTRRTWT